MYDCFDLTLLYFTPLHITSHHITGTPSISDMALIAVRNHSLLSHWVADSVLLCIDVVGTFADSDALQGQSEEQGQGSKTDRSLDRSDADSLDRERSGRDRDNHSSSHTQNASVTLHSGSEGNTVSSHSVNHKKRNFEEISTSPVSAVSEKALRHTQSEVVSDGGSRQLQLRREQSVKILLQMYELCEVLDVGDDLLSSEKSTQKVFTKKYLHPLRAIPCLARFIRTRNSDLDSQAFRNRSNQWEGDDIHFSFSRDRGACREGPFDPHRDRQVGPSGTICDDHTAGFGSTSTGRRDRGRDWERGRDKGGDKITTHVLKVSAISSCEKYHTDFDPKSIRRKQLIEQFQ